MGVTNESVYEHSSSLPVVAVTWVDMHNYRDPPPYPGHSKQVFANQPGFRQSYSGSETSTDVSLSSTENLATSQRQEPQGEENQAPFFHHYQHPHHLQNQQQQQQQNYYQNQYYQQHQHIDSVDGSSSYSILARLGMPPGGLEPSPLSFSTPSSLSSPSSSALSTATSGMGLQKTGAGKHVIPSTNITQYAESYVNQSQQLKPSLASQQQQQQHLSKSNYVNPVVSYSSSSSPSTSPALVGREDLSNKYSEYHQQRHLIQYQQQNQLQQPNYYPHSQQQQQQQQQHLHHTASSSQPLPLSLTHHHSPNPNPHQISTSNFNNNNNVPCSRTPDLPQHHSTAAHLTVPQNRLIVSNNNNQFDSNITSRDSNTVSTYSQAPIYSSPTNSKRITYDYNDYIQQLPSSSNKQQQQTPSSTPPLINSTSSSHLAFSQSSSSSSQNQNSSYYHVSYSSSSTSSSSSSSSTTTATSIPSSSTKNIVSNNLPLTSSDIPYTTGSSLPPRMANYATNPSPSHPYISPRVPPVSTYHHPHPYVNAHFHTGSQDSTTSSTHSTHSGSTSSTPMSQFHNKNLPQQLNIKASSSSSHLPPPPDYPGNRVSSSSVSSLTPRDHISTNRNSAGLTAGVAGDIRACRSYERMDKMAEVASSLGQPDVRLCASNPGIYLPDHHRIHGPSPGRWSNTSGEDSDQPSVAARVSGMVDLLTEENRSLRDELATATVKVARLLKFEVEVEKMHEAHASLLQSHEKRETLWLAMRRKLEERIRTLETVDGWPDDGKTGAKSVTEPELRTKLAEKEAIISRLLTQNQELLSNQSQLQTENMELSVSLAERKAHVEIVEKALMNAQARLLISQQQQYMTDKPSNALQLATEEGKLCSREGVESSKGHQGSCEENEKSASTCKQIQQLEKDANYWQQQASNLCIPDAPAPLKREVQMAALEKNSSDVEKLIDEAKVEKLKHIEEIHETNKKMAELEAKVKQLQTQLVEKEALVKVFQRSPLSRLPRSSSLHALCHPTSLHSPRPSLIASQTLDGEATAAVSGTHREFSSVRHMKTGSTSAIDMGRKMSLEEDLLSKVHSLNVEAKDEKAEEIQLWHV